MSSYTDYSLTELINGRTPNFMDAVTAGMYGSLFAGGFAALAPVAGFLKVGAQKGIQNGVDWFKNANLQDNIRRSMKELANNIPNPFKNIQNRLAFNGAGNTTPYRFDMEDYRRSGGGGGGSNGPDRSPDTRSGSGGAGEPKLTEPSLPKGGQLTDKELEMFNSKKKYPGIEREMDTFKTLRVKGYDVTPLKENPGGGNGFGIKPDSNPDFIIEGKVFDCYAPQGEFSKNKIKEIQGKTKKQATRIILNLDDFNLSDIDILKQEILKKANPNGDLKYLQELLVVKDGKITRWFGKGD